LPASSDLSSDQFSIKTIISPISSLRGFPARYSFIIHGWSRGPARQLEHLAPIPMVAEIRYVHRERPRVAIARYDTPLPAMRRFDAIAVRGGKMEKKSWSHGGVRWGRLRIGNGNPPGSEILDSGGGDPAEERR